MAERRSSKLGALEAFHADGGDLIREGVRSALHAGGIRQVRTFSTVEDLRRGLRAGAPDLLIAATNLGPGLLETVRDIRRYKLGRNPFLLIVLTVSEDSYAAVRGAVASGADDVVVGPVVPGVLLKRAVFLAMHRPFFIATADYLGPERRRTAHRRFDIPHLTVVNTFRDKLEGKRTPPTALQREIRTGIAAATVARLESEGRKLNWACSLILEAYQARRVDEAVLERLRIVAETLRSAAAGARSVRKAALGALCITLIGRIDTAAGHFPKLDKSDIDTIRGLADAYQAARAARIS